MRFFLFIGLSIFFLASCQQENKQESTSINFEKTREFANLWFHHSAEMEACYLQTYYWAGIALDKQLSQLSEGSKKPAVVLDLDETVLDNSPFQLKLIETKESYTSENWTAWVNLAKAKALPGATDFLNTAKEKGVEIFYISNRTIAHLPATVKNLQALNLPNADTTHVLLKDKTYDKTPRRNKVSENYEIVMLVGDNLTDFSQDFSDRNIQTMGKDVVEKNKALFGEKYIILPNPMYGEWEKTMYNGTYKWTEEQKDSLRTLLIKSDY